MNNHTCEAVVVTCIDFRFQEMISHWLAQNFKPKTFDRVAWAGGVKNLADILGQIEISLRLHHIKKVVLINHEDCGVYGEAGTPQKHAEDLREAKVKVRKLYPDLAVEIYYLHLDGRFEQIS